MPRISIDILISGTGHPILDRSTDHDICSCANRCEDRSRFSSGTFSIVRVSAELSPGANNRKTFFVRPCIWGNLAARMHAEAGLIPVASTMIIIPFSYAALAQNMKPAPSLSDTTALTWKDSLSIFNDGLDRLYGCCSGTKPPADPHGITVV